MSDAEQDCAVRSFLRRMNSAYRKHKKQKYQISPSSLTVLARPKINEAYLTVEACRRVPAWILDIC